MIENVDRYKRVCSQLDFFCKRMDDTFKLFIQLSTAVIGGFIWLKMQPDAAKVAELFPVARWIIPILSVVTIMQIGSDCVGWWGYREAEAALLERSDLRPKLPQSARLESLRMVVTAFIGLAAYAWLH